MYNNANDIIEVPPINTNINDDIFNRFNINPKINIVNSTIGIYLTQYINIL